MNILEIHQKAYQAGQPLISDEEYDKLCSISAVRENIGVPEGTKEPHLFRMYSLEKVFDDEKHYIDNEVSDLNLAISPKLDGAAISLLYIKGLLIKAITRGDGEVGNDCTEQIVANKLVPLHISYVESTVQIVGEVLLPKTVPNARNAAAGILARKQDFINKSLIFVAYGMQEHLFKTYMEDIRYLRSLGFNTVLQSSWIEYPQDGVVVRVNNNTMYESMGFTNKHPKGAYARKKSSDVEVKETELKDVIWQVGHSGKVTPVAIFNEIEIDGAKINKATLHNAEFVENLDLNHGDILLVTRSGGIIPKVLGKK